MKKTSYITIFTITLLMIPLTNLFAGQESGIDKREAAVRYNNNSQILLAQADSPSSGSGEDADSPDDDFMFDDELINDIGDLDHASIADPLEPFNRAMFHFNDKLYFWVLKPAAKGYSAVVPEPARKGIKNFFKNISFPVRFVSCILQAKFEGAGIEVDRFLINSTIGLAGFMDPAASKFNLQEYDEDLGQTFGSYGIGHGFFINWPFLGPSSVTDSFGTLGDTFLEPLHYVDMKTKYDLALYAFENVNKTSLRIGEYEDLKKAALDPYIAYRDAYFQYRQSEIKK